MQIMGKLLRSVVKDNKNLVNNYNRNRNYIFLSIDVLESIVNGDDFITTLKKLMEMDWGKPLATLGQLNIQTSTVVKDSVICDFTMIMNNVGERTVFMNTVSNRGTSVIHQTFYSAVGRYSKEWDTVLMLGICADDIIEPIVLKDGEWVSLVF